LLDLVEGNPQYRETQREGRKGEGRERKEGKRSDSIPVLLYSHFQPHDTSTSA